MQLLEVNDSSTAREFITLPSKIYQKDPNWISPMISDIESIFDPALNCFFSHGKCTRWILTDHENYTIGRIAAFINFEKANKYAEPTGGIGFFECINNKEAAYLLFDIARQWLNDNGMQAMEGPENFGENDKYWGLLIEGFKPPSLGMNYNPPYYKEFFESYGFKKSYDQFTNFLDVTKPLPERFAKISDWIMQKPGYDFRYFKKSRFKSLAADFMEIYNDAWSDFKNFVPIKYETIQESFRKMKAIMDEKIIWFAYYQNEPIAFIVCLPDINQILKHMKGKLNFWGMLKFMWFKKTRHIDRIRIIVMGCKKKFQNHGIESALIRCLQNEVLPRKTIQGVELSWVADWNNKMIAIHNATGAIKDKTHRTYRYVFHENGCCN